MKSYSDNIVQPDVVSQVNDKVVTAHVETTLKLQGITKLLYGILGISIAQALIVTSALVHLYLTNHP